MFFKRFQLLWQDTQTGGAEGLAEPSEARFRMWVLGIALLVGPPLLLLLYYKTMFPGLTNPDALDFAQIGRNLSAGRGFVTDILRPLALTHGGDPLHQPDVTHGPLFPFLLAAAFGAMGVKDTVAAGVSGAFYLLTIPVLYVFGVRVFGRAVGLLTVSIFTFNALILEYAASGMHITLYVFLMTCLLLTAYNLAADARERRENAQKPLPRAQLVLAGFLTALLYLTDPIFAWVAPVMLAAVLWFFPARRPQAAFQFLLPFCLFALPWMWRNARLTGNPVFGLRGMEVWMNTKAVYPDLIAYRFTPDELIPSVSLFKAVVEKMLFGAGQIIQAFPQVTASWVLAFFLPSLLFRFTDAATNSLRRVMLFCLLGLFAGTLLFGIQMPLFVSVIPTMLLFSVAYLLHLITQARLNKAAVGWTTALLATAVAFPLASDMTLTDKTPPLKEMSAARALGKMTQPDEVSISDQPWIIAWYADRPALWIPANDQKLTLLRQQFPTTRWLFLTDQSENFSPQWQYLHQVFQQWNMVSLQARAQKKAAPSLLRIAGNGQPLLQALDGFMSVPPYPGVTPSAVIAGVPTTPVGMQPGVDGTNPRSAEADKTALPR